jgi:hypothetical protein
VARDVDAIGVNVPQEPADALWQVVRHHPMTASIPPPSTPAGSPGQRRRRPRDNNSRGSRPAGRSAPTRHARSYGVFALGTSLCRPCPEPAEGSSIRSTSATGLSCRTLTFSVIWEVSLTDQQKVHVSTGLDSGYGGEV